MAQFKCVCNLILSHVLPHLRPRSHIGILTVCRFSGIFAQFRISLQVLVSRRAVDALLRGDLET